MMADNLGGVAPHAGGALVLIGIDQSSSYPELLLHAYRLAVKRA